MREGSLDAPVRHPIPWQDPDWLDEKKLDEELRRVFDICHGCRLCFNLCDSFPRLFDLIDESESGELDTVDSSGFKAVADACTLCDMCFMTKCPYVPPHEFNLDFPHLMLRYRAVEHKNGERDKWEERLTQTDRNGRLCSHVAPLANFGSARWNRPARLAMEAVAGVHKDADLPKYVSRTLERRTKGDWHPEINEDAPGHGKKAVIFATCFANYNNPEIGVAMREILAKNGVETEVVYPGCCGMPQMEQGDLEAVARSARTVAAELRPWIDKGYEVISLVPSCSLMLKFEWPLIETEDENVKALSEATFDAAEYIVALSKDAGLADGLEALDGGVTLHIACHARAQNMGMKAAELLRLIPDTDIKVIQRCSGHGGSWGVMKENFPVALKVGKPVARDANKEANKYIASECPLAGIHILQGIEALKGEGGGKGDGGPPPNIPKTAPHPIELFAQAYGIDLSA